MKRHNSRVDIGKSAILLLAVIVITIGATKVAHQMYENSRVYAVKEVNASFAVANKVGIAADSESLNFGIVPPGGSSQREIILQHDYTEPLKIKIIYTGTIAGVLWPITPFYLEPGIEKRVSISAYAPKGYRNYTGTVKVLYIRP